MLGLLLVLLVVAACAGESDQGSPEGAATIPPTTTSVAPTTTTVSAEKLAKAEEVGDVAAGEELFFTGMDGIPHEFSCATCHSLDAQKSLEDPPSEGFPMLRETA